LFQKKNTTQHAAASWQRFEFKRVPSVEEYGKRLTVRQDAEIAIYERAKADFEVAKKTKSDDDLVAYWESLNDQLRNLGIKLIPLE